ncbi:MAG: bifunctional (p)ppGpp synthetase/guanosine-3',5'-bis(diphosphate) 3'-pyrophosphohydrolase [Dehalococcoidia bacterium]|nr:bifunctional (p)ppGpp synthetase/guanosine-3',5'-bis(diphosphate) 3'-pyrophosphohydrolase [Dehalococcoidia bacterium]
MVVTIAPLLEKVAAYLPPEKVRLVQEAYEFARAKHEGQKRLTGEPYIIHPIETASYLADLSLDAITIAAALLHDVIEDCYVTQEELAARFGGDVARLVDGVTKLSLLDARVGGDVPPVPAPGQRLPEIFAPTKERTDQMHQQAESLRKMLVAMAQDIRVVIIKLADRLHNMRTLDAHSRERQVAIAQETMDIYAPLAHRLGMWEIKWQLEDLSFRHLWPDDYKRIAQLLQTRRAEREAYLDRVGNIVRDALKAQGIKADVYGRPKHLHSVFRKIEKYAQQGKEFVDIYDLYAIRVIVDTEGDCYHALGIIHSLWHPMPGQFDDYIANPKENQYRSLHSTVMCEGGTPLEVQIRTLEMHQLAEYGVAAHVKYKEGGAVVSNKSAGFEDKMTWLRQLLEWQRDVSGAEEFVQSLKADLFRDQVFVYTPKGDIKELPANATPLDFAYHVHTDLGHRCIGAKVNSKLVSLDYTLQNGDTVEIMVSKLARGPSLDWLNVELGFLHTASAITKVRQWFRKQERGASVERGRDLLHRELKRLSLKSTETEVAELLDFESVDLLLEQIGNGELSMAQVENKLLASEEPPAPEVIPTTKPSVPVSGAPTGSTGIRVLGVGDLLTRMGRCCAPLPGDDIIGFITRNTGVTVHRKDCKNILHEDEPERLVQVSWGPSKHLFPVTVRVAAWDRVGLLRDITALLAAEDVNITASQVETSPEGTAHISVALEISSVGQLGKLFSKLEAIKGVTSAVRADSGAGARVRGYDL